MLIWKSDTRKVNTFSVKASKNAFDEINRVEMICTFRHLWPSVFCFVFNCYHHWSYLVLRNRNWTASFLHNKEVVKQGHPPAIISYGTGILSLIKNLKPEIPDVTQPWYADNAGVFGMTARFETYCDLLTRQDLGRGYYPEPSKSVLIKRLDNIEAVKEFGRITNLRICNGARYLGGFIGHDKSKRYCLRERMLT